MAQNVPHFGETSFRERSVAPSAIQENQVAYNQLRNATKCISLQHISPILTVGLARC